MIPKDGSKAQKWMLDRYGSIESIGIFWVPSKYATLIYTALVAIFALAFAISAVAIASAVGLALLGC